MHPHVMQHYVSAKVYRTMQMALWTWTTPKGLQGKLDQSHSYQTTVFLDG